MMAAGGVPFCIDTRKLKGIELAVPTVRIIVSLPLSKWMDIQITGGRSSTKRLCFLLDSDGQSDSFLSLLSRCTSHTDPDRQWMIMKIMEVKVVFSI